MKVLTFKNKSEADKFFKKLTEELEDLDK